jgi:hypothetical protein
LSAMTYILHHLEWLTVGMGVLLAVMAIRGSAKSKREQRRRRSRF